MPAKFNLDIEEIYDKKEKKSIMVVEKQRRMRKPRVKIDPTNTYLGPQERM